MDKSTRSLVLAAWLCLLTSPAWACSTFALAKGRQLVVGNNDDWFCNVAYLVVNKRGVTKQAFLPSAGKRLEWTSKYGSLTVNFEGVGIPAGGMNEAGLVIDESWPGPNRYPAPDDRAPIDEMQWIQYQLDNSASVDDVLQTNSRVRIVSHFGQSHYFVCDKTGKVATVEWIDGKMAAYVLTQDDVQVLSNDRYDRSMAELKKHAGFGGQEPIGDSPSSLDRFFRAARMVKQFAANHSSTALDYGFEILASVSQKDTSFSWIYDVANRTIHYKSAVSPQMKTVPLDRFDFNCKGPMLMMDALTPQAGDLSGSFKPYSLEQNRAFVTPVINTWRANRFNLHITDAEMEKMIQYPETMKCTKY